MRNFQKEKNLSKASHKGGVEMKIFKAVTLAAVTLTVIGLTGVQESRASRLNPTPQSPYETWSTKKTTTMSRDRMNMMSAPKSESMLKVKTNTGAEQTLKLSAPIGKL